MLSRERLTALFFSPADVAEIVFNQCVNFEEDVDPETGKARNTSYETRGIALDFQFIEDELAPWTKVGSRSKSESGSVRFQVPDDLDFMGPMGNGGDLRILGHAHQ